MCVLFECVSFGLMGCVVLCQVQACESVLLVYYIFIVSDVLGPYGQWADWSRTKDGGSFGRARTVTSAGPLFLSHPMR